MKIPSFGNTLWAALVVTGLAATAALAQPRTVPGATYIDEAECMKCHKKETARFRQTKMGHIFIETPRTDLEKMACQACHGPGSKHAEDEKAPGLIFNFGRDEGFPVEAQNDACLACHEKGSRTHWAGSVHEGRGLACVDCHTIMKPTSDAQLAAVDEKTPFGAKRAATEVCTGCHLQKNAQLMRSSHMPVREGKLTCVSCHDPHGSVTPPLLRKANSVVDACTNCHADKRGPNLWEHPPVLEDCTNCHEAHGSIHASLLKKKAPRLCQQCHIESRHPTRPHAPETRFVFNRACLNCHPQIHGSNHPSGVRFQR